eukprot:scaffold314_cov108-Isochrysis_galbana.AAC.3
MGCPEASGRSRLRLRWPHTPITHCRSASATNGNEQENTGMRNTYLTAQQRASLRGCLSRRPTRPAGV